MDLDQESLARRIGMSQRSVSGIELGKSNLTLETMAKVSRGLGIPVPAMLLPYKPASGGTG